MRTRNCARPWGVPRRRKTALRSLSRENARLRKALRRSETRRARLEAELAKLRATGAVLARRLFGRGSERQERPRLFAGTPYGTSVWARLLFERYTCFRPLRRVAAWLSDQGLPISAGTLAGSAHRFAPLFEPVAAAILAHQNETAVRHGDETTWRVQSLREEGRSSRAWLWTSVSEDAVYFHVDPSRGAEVAKKLFGAAGRHTFIVCDRYGAYKKMARELDGAP